MSTPQPLATTAGAGNGPIVGAGGRPRLRRASSARVDGRNERQRRRSSLHAAFVPSSLRSSIQAGGEAATITAGASDDGRHGEAKGPSQPEFCAVLADGKAPSAADAGTPQAAFRDAGTAGATQKLRLSNCNNNNKTIVGSLENGHGRGPRGCRIGTLCQELYSRTD